MPNTNPTAQQYIQVPPNSTGAKMRTVQWTDDNGNLVQMEVMVLSDPNTPDNVMAVDAQGQAYIRTETVARQNDEAKLILMQSSGLSENEYIGPISNREVV